MTAKLAVADLPFPSGRAPRRLGHRPPVLLARPRIRAMPPPALPIRLDRTAEYPIHLGASLSPSPTGYLSAKYNYKPSSLLLNPSSPLLTPASDTETDKYNLTFAAPAQGGKEITYRGAAHAAPPSRAQHFLLFDPERKAFTLEKLDQAFVFNAEVYAKLHPAVSLETNDEAGGDGEIGGDGGDPGEGGEDSAYDWRKFVGRKKKSAAEEKQAKRLEALKRAGRDVVEVPEERREEVGGGGEQEVYIPGVRSGEMEVEMEVEDVDMDAPGESEDDVEEDVEVVAAPPPPPPPVQVQRKEKEKKEVRKDKPQQKKVQPPVVEDEFVLPDPTPPPQQDSDEEEIDFSDEDEPVPPPPPPPQQQLVAQTVPTPQTMEEEEEEVDDLEIDLGKELEEALGSGDDGGLVIEGGGDLEVGGMGAVGAAPKSLRELYGGGVEDEDSESEEE